MEVKIKPSDLRKEAQRMIEADQMPALDNVLTAVAEAREKFRGKIFGAREENKAGLDQLKGTNNADTE